MKNNPTIDIIIPCYNVSQTIWECVTSILNQSYTKNKVSIFLINDCSTDETGKIINSFSKDENVRVFHHKKNLGLSAARNSGINAGNGDIIFFLDSDMSVKPQWIQLHLDELEKKDVIGVVGDSQLPNGIHSNKLDRYLYHPKRGARKIGMGTPVPFQYFLFNNTSLRRSIINKFGLFNEKITTYGGEDTEYAVRIWENHPNGLRFSSRAVSYHFHPREFQDFCKSMFQYGKTNYLLLLKWYPQYSKELGGNYINSIKGKFIFNKIIRTIIKFLYFPFDSYYIKRYLVADSIIRGARSAKKDYGE